MKRNFLLLTLVATLGFGVSSSFAQQRPPEQAHHSQRSDHPDGKDEDVRYYYIPEYNAYFDAISKIYFYKKHNRWVRTSRPARISRNIGQAKREPLNDIKDNEKPYEHNAAHIQTWKGQQESGHR